MSWGRPDEMKTYTRLKEILGEGMSGYQYDNAFVEVTKQGDAWEIKWEKMYEAPGLNLAILMKLGETLGTLDISEESFSYGGCETCDYVSSYGFTLTVKNVTKNQDILEPDKF